MPARMFPLGVYGLSAEEIKRLVPAFDHAEWALAHELSLAS